MQEMVTEKDSTAGSCVTGGKKTSKGNDSQATSDRGHGILYVTLEEIACVYGELTRSCWGYHSSKVETLKQTSVSSTIKTGRQFWHVARVSNGS